MVLDFIRNMLRGRHTFDDGSYLQFADREALLYAEADGHQMAVRWWFGPGLGRSRIVYEGDIDAWLPPHRAEVVTTEKQREVLGKIVRYCRDRRIRLEVKAGTTKVREDAVDEPRWSIEFGRSVPEWLTADADHARPFRFRDDTSMELMRGRRILYAERDGHQLILNWELMDNVGDRRGIRIADAIAWEAPFEGEQITANKLNEIRQKLAWYIGQHQ